MDAILDLRHRVLRAGLPRATASFEGDDEPATLHFCARDGAEVVGCATILQRPWEGRAAWQLRGMAVEPRLQRGGVGRRLVEAVEAHVLSDAHARLMWCNARVPAAPFYERLGWVVRSQPFDIPRAGPHVRMTRSL